MSIILNIQFLHHRKHSVSITKTDLFKRFREVISDFSYTHINTLFRKIYGLWKLHRITAVVNTVSLWLIKNYLVLQT